MKSPVYSYSTAAEPLAGLPAGTYRVTVIVDREDGEALSEGECDRIARALVGGSVVPQVPAGKKRKLPPAAPESPLVAKSKTSARRAG